jgi:hypothetical protein
MKSAKLKSLGAIFGTSGDMGGNADASGTKLRGLKTVTNGSVVKEGTGLLGSAKAVGNLTATGEFVVFGTLLLLGTASSALVVAKENLLTSFGGSSLGTARDIEGKEPCFSKEASSCCCSISLVGVVSIEAGGGIVDVLGGNITGCGTTLSG